MNFNKHLLVTLLIASSNFVCAAPMIPAPEVPAKSFSLVDISTGAILAEDQADAKTEIASLTKVMTAYVAFSEIKNGSLKLTDELHVSKKAWKTDGSKMFIEAGKKVLVEDILRGIIIVSGNDASVALAEHIAGTEAQFVDLMNRYAESIGMKDTVFANSTGLPSRIEQYSTAHDLAMLATRLYQDFPEYVHYFNEDTFTYNDITQPNRNRLLKESEYYRGLKTGYTARSGYSIMSSYEKDDRNVITVVLNSKTVADRFMAAKALTSYGVRRFKKVTPISEGQKVTEIPVYYGVVDTADVYAGKSITATIPIGIGQTENSIHMVATLHKNGQYDAGLFAPVKSRYVVGKLTVYHKENEIGSVDLVTKDTIPEGNAFKKLKDWVELSLNLSD